MRPLPSSPHWMPDDDVGFARVQLLGAELEVARCRPSGFGATPCNCVITNSEKSALGQPKSWRVNCFGSSGSNDSCKQMIAGIAREQLREDVLFFVARLWRSCLA